MSSLLRILAGVGVAITFVVLWGSLFGFSLQLGSHAVPRAGQLVYHVLWGSFGALALFLVGPALGTSGLSDRIRRGSDTAWMLGVGATAILGALLAHFLVFQGVALTDDEGAYRFMAQVLLDGRLSAMPPPGGGFYERVFMVVGPDRWHAQYFLGWPLLLAPFEAVGLSALANPVLHGLTTLVLYQIVRRCTEPAGARAAALFWALAPMNVLGAASLLSHTSCTLALAIALWGALASREHAPWAGVAVGLGTALAFTIRPLSAVGIGAPIVLFWAYHALIVGRARAVQALGFALPVVGLATAFLATNLVQNGSLWRVSYAAYMAHAADNGFQFSAWPAEGPSVQVSNLSLDPRVVATMAPIGLWRLAFALLAAPALLVVGLRWPADRDAGLLWACCIAFVFVHLPLANAGVDVFGPTHWFELGLPLIALLGVSLARRGAVHWLLAGLLVAVPVELALRSLTIHELAGRADAIPRLTRDLDPAIVFVPAWRWSPNCDMRRAFTHRLWRPVNAPDLSGRIVWANHLDVASDRAHAGVHHPDRQAWIVTWDSKTCAHGLVPLDEPAAASLPDGDRYFVP